MKGSRKLLLILTLVIFLTAAFGIFAFANEEPQSADVQRDDRVENSFEVYLNGTTTRYTSASTLKSKIASGNAANNNIVITLLDDFVINSSIDCGATVPTETTGFNVYLDLNGYDLIYNYRGYTFIEIGGYVNFHLYSSQPGGQMIATYQPQNSTAQNSYTLFNLRYNGASLIAGEVTPPAVRNNATGTYDNNVTCSGDNLTTRSASLFTTYYSSSTEGYPDTHLHDVTIDINGGTYYRSTTQRDALLLVEGNSTLNARNATFISKGKGSTATANSKMTESGNKINFTNCLFYADSVLKESHKNAEITFTDCRLIADMLIESFDSNSNAPRYNNCSFAAGLIPGNAAKTVKTYFSERINVSTATFNYTSDTVPHTYNVTVEGVKTTKTDYYNKVDVNSPYTASVTEEILDFRLQTVEEGDFASITWVGLDGKTVTEEWAKGDNIIPVPAIIPPAATDSCKYMYSPRILPTSTGDRTYRIVRAANFSVKTNLTLYTDFVYNIYLPESIVSAGYINSVKVTDSASVDPKTLETVDIDGVTYRVLKKEIPVINGDKSFDFTMNINDAAGVDFNTVYTFSIPDYINRVLEGNYNERQKNMVNATYTYIKAARNYFTQTETLPYPEADNTDLTELPHITGVKMPERSEELREIFYGMTLSLEGQIRFRFYVNREIAENSPEKMSMIFTYYVNTYETKDYVTSKDWTDTGSGPLYYELVMKARDLRDIIQITLGTEEKAEPDFSYRLAYYAYYANDTENTVLNRDKLTKLVDALWNYSAVANKYIHGTPDVDVVIGGNAVSADTHVIVASGAELTAAEALRDSIYDATGEMLEISGTEVSGKNSIIVSLDTPNVDYDFRASVINDDLIISCGYKSFIDAAMENFIGEYIAYASKNITFNDDFVFSNYTDKIYYSDFGAIGNDKTSKATDFPAINNAHIMANRTKRHTVYADADAVYYIDNAKINNTVTTIPINSNVEWGNAKFIIDDTGLSPLNSGDNLIYNEHIFEVCSDYPEMVIEDKTILGNINPEKRIHSGTKVIDLGLGYPAMIIPSDSDHKVFRRRGYDSWEGSNMHEIIVIDENGNVDPETPIMFDYTSVDNITVIRLDIEPIVINGGNFESVASAESIIYYKNGNTKVKVTNDNRASVKAAGHTLYAQDAYFARGIDVKRSFTTIKGLNHTISGEISLEEQAKGNIGVAYTAFFSAHRATDVTYEDCIMQGRRCYNKASAGISGGTMGTYDVNATEINNLVYKNCIQNNFWITVDSDNKIHNATENTDGAKLSMASAPTISGATGYQMHWGIGGSNFCKNLQYIGSTLSRLDAHAGMYNGKLIDSTINFISLTGYGDFIMENSRWFAQGDSTTSNSLIYLRNDYGSTWNGTVYIKNVEAYPYIDPTTKAPTATYLFYHSYVNWYFGYQSCFPNVYIDNLDYYNRETGEAFDAGHTIYLTTHKTGFSEPRLHLSTVTKKDTYYNSKGELVDPTLYPNVPDVDINKNGIVDETEGKGDIAYDSTINTNGVKNPNTRENVNPVRPPEYVYIMNNDGVNGAGGYNFVFPDMTKTTFFDNTSILIDSGKFDINHLDSPMVPFN